MCIKNVTFSSQCGFFRSKWDSDPAELKLGKLLMIMDIHLVTQIIPVFYLVARLDGVSKPFHRSTTLEDYLQIDGWEPPPSSSNNKKRVSVNSF